ncbi:hypothetical protein UFOVP33_11 [uncultured Caudovirales phage]|uniref:Uncharacterized protein n=1 Tax=uncultured Caudovirales phage TaxID=2100421 RepID=A0A6J5KJY3_9CAUD|nr:hypothetical protein UFOVP33_11 [uncultured Caudovirales phage]
MPFSLVPTPILELMLNESDHPKTEQAIEELNRLREIHCHLATHLIAVKQQTDASVAGIQSLLGEVEPSPAPKLPRR